MRREESMRLRVCLIFMPPLRHLCWRTRPTSALGLFDKRRESFTLVPGLLRSAHASWSRVLKSHFFHVRFVVSLEESSRFGVLKKKATKSGWPTSNVKNRRRLCVTPCDPHCTPTPHPHPPTSLDFEHQTRADAVILYRPGRERILSTMGQFIIEKKGEKSWWWCWVDGTERTRVWPQHVALYFIFFFIFILHGAAPTEKCINFPLEAKVLRLFGNRLRPVPKPPASQEWFTLTIYFNVYYSLKVLYRCLNWFTCKQWGKDWMCLRNESFRNGY